MYAQSLYRRGHSTTGFSAHGTPLLDFFSAWYSTTGFSAQDCAYAHFDKSGVSVCRYLKFRLHTQKIQLWRIARAENSLSIRLSLRIVGTCAYTMYCEVWSFCASIPDTLVTCAENPLVEYHAQKIQ